MEKSKMVYGPTTGPGEEEAEDDTAGVGTRVAKAGRRVSTTFVVFKQTNLRCLSRSILLRKLNHSELLV